MGESEHDISMSTFVVKIIFYVLMIFVVTAVFEALGYSILIQPLNQFLGSIFVFSPKFIGALILFIIAWILATALRIIVVKALVGIKIDEKIKGDSDTKVSLSGAVGDILFWFIVLIFLPGILSALSLEGILDPIQNLLNKILDAFPNILAAGIIILFGWFIAKKIKEICIRIFASIGMDRVFGDTEAENESMPLSVILGNIIYILILIPVLTAGLDMIGLSVVTVPAMNMIESILLFLPKIFAALVIVYLAYFLGSIVGDIFAGVVSKIKIQKFLLEIGFLSSEKKDMNLGKPVGKFIKLVIIFFTVLEATNILGLIQVSMMLDQFILLIGKIILGLVVIAIGLYLAQVLGNLIKKKESASAEFLEVVTKGVIIFLSLAMGLRQMGIANEIINTAFGFTIGAIAIASAIAFGTGGKDMAKKVLERLDKGQDK